MRCDLNLEILKPKEILQWAAPETPHEKLLFDALRQAIDATDAEQIQICDELKLEIAEGESRITELETENNEQAKLIDELNARVDELETELKQLDQQAIN